MDQENEVSGISIAVLLPGRADDGGWSEAGARAASVLGQNEGWRIEVLAPLAPDLAHSVAKSLANNGFRLVIGHGCEYIDAFLQLAPRYSATSWFVMDTVDFNREFPQNYASLYQRQDEASFLCGRLAAHITHSNKVGFLAGQRVPTQVANSDAFEQGVHSYSSTVDVFVEFAGSFDDPSRGYEIASELIQQGADLLMHSASETGNGLIAACRERDVAVIGYTLDQRELAPKQMITSLVVDVAAIYRQKAQQVENGLYRSGIWEVGLADGMVGLAPFREDVSRSVRNDLIDTKNAIVEGAIVI